MSVRAFVAIDLSTSVRALAVDVRTAFLDACPGWAGEKWVADDALHVTLKFLGYLGEDRLRSFADAFRAACTRHEPFELVATGVRAVPGVRRASMLWLTAEDPAGGSAVIARDADDLAAAFGVQRDARAFVPHVTLVRTRKSRSVPAEALATAESVVGGVPHHQRVMSVAAATLYASTLTRTGPVYETLERFAIGS